MLLVQSAIKHSTGEGVKIMKQRISSIILIVTLLLGSFSGLEGCGKQQVENSAYITQGEWISLINDAFGMYSYLEDTPYYTNIDRNNPYFEQIQIAREWDVIDGSVSEFDTNAYVSYGFAAVTLINVTGFVPNEVSAGQKISIAQEMGLLVTETTEYEITDHINYNDAIVSLYYAKQQWANTTFDHVVEEVTFAEDVVNYIEEEVTDYEIKDGKTYIPAQSYKKLKEGDIYVLPSNKDNLVASAFTVAEVAQEGNYFVITNNDKEENILEHIESLNIEETFMADLLASNIYDGNGKLIHQGSEYAYVQRTAAEQEYPAYNLMNNEDMQVLDIGAKGEIGFKFQYEGASISGTIGKDSVKFALEQKLGESEYSTVEGGKNNGKESYQLFAEAEVKDIKVTNDVDMSWGKLNRAKVAVDYSHSIEGGLKVTGRENLRRVSPYNNSRNSFLTNFKKAVSQGWVKGSEIGATQISGSAKGIKICGIDLVSAGITKVVLEVYVYVEASGKISLKVTTSSCKGVEYVNGKIRYINTDNQTRELIINASIECGLNFKLKLEILKQNAVAVDLKIGLGVEVKLIVNFVDSENHLIETGSLDEPDMELAEIMSSCGATISLEDMKQIAKQQGGDYVGTVVTEQIPLHVDNCMEIGVYFKVSLGLDTESWVGKIIKVSDKAKIEFKQELVKVHLDNLTDLSFSSILSKQKSTSCTKKFTPFTKLEKEDAAESKALEEQNPEKDTLTYDYEKGEYLGISKYSMHLTEGQTDQITVSLLPEEYHLKDVKFAVGDEDIARVSEDGTVLGLHDGVTHVRVYIPGTQFEMRCAIIVGEETSILFSPLKEL